MGSVAPWLVLSVLLVVPVLVLGGWWLVARADNPTRAAAPVASVVVPVTHEDVQARSSVAVAVGDAPGREAAVALAGTVTAAATAGTVLSDGVVVLQVDDRPIRAMVASAPVWRTLAVGDKGADVARVQQYLVALGYLRGSADGTFGQAMRRAVEAFNVDAGLGKGVATFDGATVVWVGPEPLTVVDVLAAQGSAVGLGTPVVRGPGVHDVVTVTEPQGGIGSTQDFGGAAILTIGPASVPYLPGSGAVTVPEDVAALQTALAPAADGTAQVTSAVARPVAIVPASALVQGADGTLCVYAAADAKPQVVQPVGGGVSSTQLPDDLPLKAVLANPGRVDLAVPCGS